MFQSDLDHWLDYSNKDRTHTGKMFCGKEVAALEDVKIICEKKIVA